MSDRAALYAAMCADPDDDTPRLVLADWLEEHGQARRANFIRLRVARDRRHADDTEAAWVHHFLQDESGNGRDRIDWSKADAELGGRVAADGAEERSRVGVTAKTEGVPRMKGVQFEGHVRGFLGTVIADDGAAFLRHADAIFRAVPVTEVVFNLLAADAARAIADRGLLARIRELAIWDMEDAEPLRILGTHPDAAGVRALALDWMGADGEDVAEALIRGKRWTGLRRLEMTEFGESDDPMTDEQGARLFRRPVFAGLRELIAWRDDLGDTTARAVAAGGMPELRHLDLSVNHLTGDGFTALARAKGLKNLRSLDLASNDEADGAATAAVITSANLPNLTVLKLNGPAAGSPDPKVLAKPGRAPGLRVLDLAGCTVSGPSAAALAGCPAARGLWYLGLNNCGLTAAASRALLKAAGFDRLTVLDLAYNVIDAKAVQALAKWPGAAALQWLDLNGNNLTADALLALAESPHLGGLKYLSADGPATSAGWRRLRKRLGKALYRI